MSVKVVGFIILLLAGIFSASISYGEVSSGIDSMIAPFSADGGCALIFPSRKDTRTSIFLFLWVGPLAIIIWKWIRHKTQRWY